MVAPVDLAVHVQAILNGERVQRQQGNQKSRECLLSALPEQIAGEEHDHPGEQHADSGPTLDALLAPLLRASQSDEQAITKEQDEGENL